MTRPAGSPAPPPACARRGVPGRRSARPPAQGMPRPRLARRGPARGRRVLQLRGDLLIWPGRCLRPVPGPPVGISLGVGGAARAACASWRPGIDADGRQPSGSADAGTARGDRTRPALPPPRCRRVRRDAQASGRSPHQRRVAGWIGRREQHQPPGLIRQGSSRRPKLSSIRPVSGTAPGSPNPPASSAGDRPRGSSSSASGLPSRLREDEVPHPRVQRPGQCRLQQRPGVLSRSPRRRAPAVRPVPSRGPGPRTPGRPGRRPAAGWRIRAPAPRRGRATARHRSGR